MSFGDRLRELRMDNNYSQKKVAKDEYMEAKKKYLKTMSTEDWKVYCDKKRVCMLLGVLLWFVENGTRSKIEGRKVYEIWTIFKKAITAINMVDREKPFKKSFWSDSRRIYTCGQDGLYVALFFILEYAEV